MTTPTHPLHKKKKNERGVEWRGGRVFAGGVERGQVSLVVECGSF
jgi:hypothetical protein